MIRRYLLAAIFAACTICAPIFTEAIASPVDHNAIIVHSNSALPAAIVADNTAVPVARVHFCAVTARSPDETLISKKQGDDGNSIQDRYHMRC